MKRLKGRRKRKDDRAQALDEKYPDRTKGGEGDYFVNRLRIEFHEVTPAGVALKEDGSIDKDEVGVAWSREPFDVWEFDCFPHEQEKDKGDRFKNVVTWDLRKKKWIGWGL